MLIATSIASSREIIVESLKDGIQGAAPGAGRYRARRRGLCAPAAGGKALLRSLSIPQREDAVVFRLAGASILQMLRLRCEGRCLQIRRDDRRADVFRGPQKACRSAWHCFAKAVFCERRRNAVEGGA